MLDAHCRLHGTADARFCDLKARYFEDPNMGPDDVLMELTQIATPEQMAEVRADIQGTALANRWAEGYLHGR